MATRLLIFFLLFATATQAQVFQTNNQPYRFRGIKATDLLIAPKGCDTTALTNPRWGESTAGALFVDTCNNKLYFFNGLKWNQVTGGGADSFYFRFRNLNDTTLLWDRGDGVVDTLAFSASGAGGVSGANKVDSVTVNQDSLFYNINGNRFFVTNLATATSGGDTTIFEVVLDSTGQPQRRMLFSGPGNRISSSPRILVDSANSKLVINNPNISIGGPGMQLYVLGNTTLAGFARVGTMELYGISTPVTDTNTYKPLSIDNIGNVRKLDRWPITDTSGTGSLYIRNQFASKEDKAFNIRAGRLDSLYAAGSGGLHFATNSGATAFEYGGGGGTQVTFNGFAGYNANRAASYTARSFTDKNYVDSAITAIPTVVSYGKNAGGDSTVLVLSNGQRFAAKDSTGGGGGITIDSVAVRRIPQGLFNHYVGFNAGVGGTGTSGGVVTAGGNGNFVIGENAGLSMRTSGTFLGGNYLIGPNAGRWLTGANGNIAIGFSALAGNVAGSLADSLWGSNDQIAIGTRALRSIRGNDPQSKNIAIGFEALRDYQQCSGCATSNTAVGTQSMLQTTTGVRNVAVGPATLFSQTTGSNNVAVGFNVLAVGNGSNNVGIGDNALGGSSMSGGDNVAVGSAAGIANTSGVHNTFLGRNAAYDNSTGSYNVGIGGGLFNQAARPATTGSQNLAIMGESRAATSGSYNMAIGYGVQSLSLTNSNQLAIGGNAIRWLVSDVSGSHRRWTLNGTTTDVTANTASVTLDITGTLGGVRFPRLTTTQRDALTATEGLLIFNTTTKKLQVHDGTNWVDLH